ncbi:hypothetical protein J5N97_022185 [Dioscorea zingiberensis]|uniref:WW domain-containing protein n=1 Tax=Dioscorea zingiberensis TaxID=325984 RepID=A0A9D5CAP3_9LILI|nr:hypothetical protein J5N97_022185 [Dioscorea zingiberensis]
MNAFFSSSSSSSKEDNIMKLAKEKSFVDVHPKLSLAPSSLSTFNDTTYTSSSESEANSCRKRKMLHTSIELHLNHPLPFDWEQCLDLQSGRVYYMNRETLKRSWSRPKERRLDLELNISTNTTSMEEKITSCVALEDEKKGSTTTSSSMVAMPCINCHLLVMLCKSSPTCPNCKYVYPLHALQKEEIQAMWHTDMDWGEAHMMDMLLNIEDVDSEVNATLAAKLADDVAAEMDNNMALVDMAEVGDTNVVETDVAGMVGLDDGVRIDDMVGVDDVVGLMDVAGFGDVADNEDAEVENEENIDEKDVVDEVVGSKDDVAAMLWVVINT